MIKSTGSIANLPRPDDKQNLSYTLRFRAPQVACKDTITNSTTYWNGNLDSDVSFVQFNPAYDQDYTPLVQQRAIFGFYSPRRVIYDTTDGWNNNDMELNDTASAFAAEIKELECQPLSVL